MQQIAGLGVRAMRAMRASGSVCRRCLARAFTQSSVRSALGSAPPPNPAPSGIATLSTRRLLTISGPDAARFLQGAITASVVRGSDHQPRRDGFYAAFLTAQGRVLYDVFVYPDTLGAAGPDAKPGDSFLIEVGAAEAEGLQKHIKKYKLRAKFDTRVLDQGELSVWHAWDEDLAGVTSYDILVDRLLLAGLKGIVLKDTRAPGLGYRIVAPGGDILSGAAGLEPMSEDTYRLRRYINGVGEGQEELLKEHALPLESNMDFMGAIDWHKGCYVGQELTIRTRHRGVVRKRILPCVLYAEDQPMPMTLDSCSSVRRDSNVSEDGPGMNALAADMIPTETSIGRVGRKGRSAGKWIKGVGSVGLALCRLEVMTDITLPGETAASAFVPEDEFVMHFSSGDEADDRGVRVKAFMPCWLRLGILGHQ